MAQLRSGYCSSLNSYLVRVGRSDTSTSPRCAKKSPAYLFDCPQDRITWPCWPLALSSRFCVVSPLSLPSLTFLLFLLLHVLLQGSRLNLHHNPGFILLPWMIPLLALETSGQQQQQRTDPWTDRLTNQTTDQSRACPKRWANNWRWGRPKIDCKPIEMTRITRDAQDHSYMIFIVIEMASPRFLDFAIEAEKFAIERAYVTNGWAGLLMQLR